MNHRGAEIDPQEMTFLEHLEELRWVLIRAGIALVVAASLAFPVSEWLMREVLIRPLHVHFPEYTLIYLKPAGYFLALITISLWTAAIVALPYIAWEFWRFIAPGLFVRERKMIPVILGITIICFLLGASLAYFVVLPLALRFFLNLGSDLVVPQIEVKEYLSFSLRLIFAFGIVFELPVLAFFLARAGLLTSAFLRNVRSYAVVAIAMLAAVITPPDPVSMLLLMGPLVVLYEISIGVAALGARKYQQVLERGPED
jgi:sec-independent protein translocase protein TatC